LNLPELMPAEVGEARNMLYLCDRFHKLPEEILATDASLLYLLAIERLSERQNAE